MDELRELYQQVILDHNKNPKNFGKLDPHTHEAEGYNPLCGDKVFVYLSVKDNQIEDVRFEGSGCAISKASASVMTTMVKGKSLAEAKALFEDFQKMITAELGAQIDMDKMGKLAVFAGVREFPSRVKCAALSWHAMTAAIEGDQSITTE